MTVLSGGLSHDSFATNSSADYMSILFKEIEQVNAPINHDGATIFGVGTLTTLLLVAAALF